MYSEQHFVGRMDQNVARIIPSTARWNDRSDFYTIFCLYKRNNCPYYSATSWNNHKMLAADSNRTVKGTEISKMGKD